MRVRPDRLLKTAGVGGAGAIWGLGLARLAAEAGHLAWLHVSPLAVAGLVAVCAAVVLALWRWMERLGGRAPAAITPLALPLLYVAGAVSRPLGGCVLVVGGAVLALMIVWGDRVRWLAPVVLGLLVFSLYLSTLLPSVAKRIRLSFR